MPYGIALPSFRLGMLTRKGSPAGRHSRPPGYTLSDIDPRISIGAA